MRRLLLLLALVGLTLGAAGPAGALTLTSPIVATLGASAVTPTSATLSASVNPVGQDTIYHFDYGTTTAYDHHTTVLDAGSGVLDVPVSAAVTGLSPGTTYHFRLSAVNASGTTLGLDQSFTTPGPPSVHTGPATAVAAGSATLTGTVNPGGLATTYFFQYGTGSAYGLQTPSQSAAAGVADVAASAALTGLTPGTTYHYRLTATNAAGSVPGLDQTFATPGSAPSSKLVAVVNPAGGNADLALTLTIGADAAGNPLGQASVIAEALSSQFSNQLASFGTCAAAKFASVQGPTAANCPDRTAILGPATVVTRGPSGADSTSDQGFVVKTAANQVVIWWHTPAATGTSDTFGQITGVVTQETGLYGPVVTYDLTQLAAGTRLKQLALGFSRNATIGKAPFAATACAGGSWQLQARIVYLGGVAAELPTTTVACGLPPAPQPSKLQLLRATILPSTDQIDILAPISRRASGNVSIELQSAGQRFRWSAAINSTDGRVRSLQTIPAAQAHSGTGILTITYPGNAATRPQVVRLRAASFQALLDASRPTISSGGHLLDHGTISTRARGVVRVQLEYYSGGRTTTLQKFAHIASGTWSLDAPLTADEQAAIAKRQGTVQSYILFTGYFPRRIRGEMVSYQVLGNP
jgi:hypothetical protein